MAIRYTWGNSDHGRLGHQVEERSPQEKNSRRLNPRSPSLTLSKTPKKVAGVLSNQKVIQVSCGHTHTVFPIKIVQRSPDHLGLLE